MHGTASPCVFGFLAAWATKQFLARGQTEVLAEQLGHRAALFSITAFLLVGLVLLLLVNEKKGRACGAGAVGSHVAGLALALDVR